MQAFREGVARVACETWQPEKEAESLGTNVTASAGFEHPDGQLCVMPRPMAQRRPWLTQGDRELSCCCCCAIGPLPASDELCKVKKVVEPNCLIGSSNFNLP